MTEVPPLEPWAEQNGSDDWAEYSDAPAEAKTSTFRPRYPTPPPDVVYPAQLNGEAPPRPWLVWNWIPLRTVTLLSGDGGVGKSLLAMQLLTSCATGLPWLGQEVMKCPAVGIFCEDEREELWRRQQAINRDLQITMADLRDLVWMPRVGSDNILVAFDRHDGTMEPTGLYQQIHNLTQDTGARLLVADALHDFYSGNENDRVQARRFINLLAQLACDMDGAVVLCAHPSLSGIASGSGLSGSTAWHNAVRSRLYLTRPKDEDGEEAEDERTLARKKANYAGLGESLPLHWDDGVFVADVPPTGIVAHVEKNKAEAAFLEGLKVLTGQGVNLSFSHHAVNYAPKAIARIAAGRRHKPAALARAMNDLFDCGVIGPEAYKRNGESYSRVAIIAKGEGEGETHAA